MEVAFFIDKRSLHLQEFLELITSEKYVSFGDLRKKFPNTTAHSTIQNFIFKTNSSIKSLFPNLEVFSLDLLSKEGKISRGYTLKAEVKFETTNYHYVLLITTNESYKSSV